MFKTKQNKSKNFTGRHVTIITFGTIIVIFFFDLTVLNKIDVQKISSSSIVFEFIVGPSGAYHNENDNDAVIDDVISGAMTAATTLNTVADDDTISINTGGTRLPHLKCSFNFKYSSLLLQVPFYVYEDEAFQWHTNDTTIVTVTTSDNYNSNTSMTTKLPFIEWFHNEYLPAPNGSNPKHTDDYWFLQAALCHPMRTFRPEDAQIFIVPTLLNQLMYMKDRFCIHGDKCWNDLVDIADEVLGNSKWFQRHNGKDHLIVMSHSNPKRRLPRRYNSKRKKWTYKHLTKCNILGYYDQPSLRFNDKTRLFFPKHYVSVPCQPIDDEDYKVDDFAMVAAVSDNKEHKTRLRICKWIKSSSSSSSSSSTTMAMTNYSMPVCGFGAQCPTLAQAKFGFHVRGDQLGSNRLADTVLSGTVPIFSLKKQFDVLPSWIDWDSLTYFADVSKDQTTFLEQISTIYNDLEGYQQRRSAILSNRDLFDWRHSLVPFDTILYQLSINLNYDESNPPSLQGRRRIRTLPDSTPNITTMTRSQPTPQSYPYSAMIL
jgi:Exostosin family